MEFSSQELNNASGSPSSVTDNNILNINLEQIKNDLRLFILTKDKSLIKPYDITQMRASRSSSGNETLGILLSILKETLLDIYRNDNVKNLTIRKTFDILNLSLENLSINGIDLNSNQVNTILISFVNKNFLC